MESGAAPTPSPLAPRACVECAGNGTVVRLPATCHHGGQNCPCGIEEPKCPRCEGSGIEPCDSCGEPSTMRYLAADLCDACAPAEEQRFDSCSLCDGWIDVRESPVPLCPSCAGTAKAHAQLEREAREYEREERETGRRIA